MKIKGKYVCQDGEILRTQESLPIEISLQELFLQLTTDEILELGRKLEKRRGGCDGL